MRVLFLLLIYIFFYTFSKDVQAKDFYFDAAGAYLSLKENSVIEKGVEVSYDTINISRTILLENYGKLTGDIFIESGNDFFVKNNGDIQANFYLGENADIIQVINEDKDITNIEFSHAFKVLVQNAENIKFNSILSLGADKIIIEDSKLIIGNDLKTGFARLSLNPEIEIIGNIDIYLKSEDLLLGPLLSNVEIGDGNVNIHVDGSNPLYAVSAYIKDNNLYAELVRETDYEKIFNNDTGVFINKLRDKNPEHLLLKALDKAPDIDSVNQIINRSVLFNPAALLKPVKTYNNFKLLDLNFDSVAELVFSPDVIMSDSFYSYGLNIRADLLNYDRFKLSLNAYGSYIDFTDDINEYVAIVAGIKTDIVFIPVDYLFFNLTAGGSFAKFNVEDIFYNEKIINNPDSLSLYSATDLGIFLIKNDKLIISAFSGFVMNHNEIVDISDSDYDVRLGVKLDFADEEIGNVYYKYNVLLIAETDGNVGAGLGYSFFSRYDGAGAGIDIYTFKDECGWNYKLSLNMKLSF